MMESVKKKLNPHGIGNNGLATLNSHILEKLKDIRDSIFAEGQGCSEEESKINDFTGDMSDGQAEEDGLAASEVGLQKHQRTPKPVVRWERFLSVRTLKVLLVENDNSTRHVLTALLCNCGYEVVATSNGIQAWKILEDLDNNHIDLVLTEVVMACLSGFRLLCKIMKHKSCKNIPVIMMSSNDSMCTVFKCLSKGAVDFLVKPIRKNELKNLWQHVWRRCHSSSASGSVSGIQTRNSTKSDDSDNNAGSNDNEGNGSIGLNVRDGSDNGSGTQNSWTKRAVEVDTPQPMSPSYQVANPHDSTCAQVIHSKPEAFCNRWVPVKTANESREQKELVGNAIMGTDLEIGIARTHDVPQKFPPDKVLTGFTVVNADNLEENDPKKAMEDNEPEIESSNATAGLSAQAEDLIGGIGNSTVAQVRGADEAHNGYPTISGSKDKTVVGSNELPSLQLSLKRLRSSEEDGSQTATHDARNVLRHSDQSAFSRYDALATSSQDPTGYPAGCSVPRDKCSEPSKTESMQNMISSSNAAPLKQGSNGSSYGNDMGSTTKNVCTNPPASKEKTPTTSVSKPLKNPSAFRPLQRRACTTQEVLLEKADNISAAPVNQAGVPPCQVQVQHQHHHYHHLHHHMHNMLQQKTLDHNDLSLKNMAVLSMSCGSSNMLVGAMDDNAANFSLKGSNSCSNCGGNGRNGSSVAVSDGGRSVEIDKLSRTAGAGDGNGRLAIWVDQNQLSQREAAIDKFRQKRKQRNFEKKVRYQSRKRLAEQRPRVRGQFVRQDVTERRKPDANS